MKKIVIWVTILMLFASTSAFARVAPRGNGIVTGVVLEPPSNTFISNVPPSNLVANPDLGNISLAGSSTQTITSGSYKYGRITTRNSARLIINGDVSLYLTDNTSIDLNDSSYIEIADGSSLTIYFDGSLTAENGILNLNGTEHPGTLQLYGTATADQVRIRGGQTIGLINAPDADVEFRNDAEVYGALIANSLDADGTSKFHYDERLQTSGPSDGYKLSWARRT